MTTIVESLKRIRPTPLGFALLVAADAGEALAPLRSLLWKAVAVTVFMLAAAGLLMLGMGTRLMQGLAHTREAMVAVGEGGGDLTRRLPEQGRDEVARIGAAFNAFIARLPGTLREVNGSTGSISVAAGELAMGRGT